MSLSKRALVGFQRKISTLSEPSIAVHLKVALLLVIVWVILARLIFAPGAVCAIGSVLGVHSPDVCVASLNQISLDISQRIPFLSFGMTER